MKLVTNTHDDNGDKFFNSCIFLFYWKSSGLSSNCRLVLCEDRPRPTTVVDIQLMLRYITTTAKPSIYSRGLLSLLNANRNDLASDSKINIWKTCLEYRHVGQVLCDSHYHFFIIRIVSILVTKIIHVGNLTWK